MYSSLYEYFMDVVIRKGDYTKCLEGQTMKSNPTQRESTDALKKVWQKLGGTVVAMLAFVTSLNAAVAKIDGEPIRYYDTLKEAFAAVSTGEKVTLLENTQVDACLTVSNRFTFDIGSYTVTPQSAFTTGTSKDAIIAIRYGGDLTVNGSTGIIDSSLYPSVYCAIKLTEKGEIYDGVNRAKLTVNANLKGYYYAIVGNGGRPGTDITVNGGNLTAASEDNTVIFNPQIDSTVTINGGVLHGDGSAIEIRGGTLTVNGGTIEATGTKYEVTPSGSGTTTIGAAIAVSQHTTKGDISVTITNATVRGLKSVSVTNPQGNDTSNVVVNLEKATYDGDLAFAASGNAKVVDYGSGLAAPEGYIWIDGVLCPVLPLTTKWQDVPPDITLNDALVSRTTAEQASNIAVKASADKATLEQATNAAVGVVSKIHINGQQLSENVSITTFAPFVSSWRTSGGTMDQLCEDISNDPTAIKGMCFLGEISGKDQMPDVILGNCEVIVKICKNGVLNFEAFSTDTGTKHWDGVALGSYFLGWRQVITAPEVTENGTYILKMTVGNGGYSKSYQWVKE